MVDIDNNLIVTDNSTIGTLSAHTSQVQVMKSKSVKAQEGTLFFNDAIIIGPPGENILIKLNADSINEENIMRSYPSITTYKTIYL